jgi:hypothetical protein
MRKVMLGVLAAVVMSSTVAVMAANPKNCWAHSEDNSGTNYTAVWTNGGGHDSHEADVWLGSFNTYAECLAAFGVV